MQGISSKELGRGLDWWAQDENRDDLAHLVGYLMYERSENGQFIGGIEYALRELFGQADVQQRDRSTIRKRISRRLVANGFMPFTGPGGNGWKVPESFTWTKPEPVHVAWQPDTTDQPAPGPVTTRWQCRECGKVWPSRNALGGHSSRAHPRNITDTEHHILQIVKDNPGVLLVEMYKLMPEVNKVAIATTLTRLAKRNRVRRGGVRGRYEYFPKNYRPAVQRDEAVRTVASAPPAALDQPAPPVKIHTPEHVLERMGGKPVNDPEATPRLLEMDNGTFVVIGKKLYRLEEVK